MALRHLSPPAMARAVRGASYVLPALLLLRAAALAAQADRIGVARAALGSPASVTAVGAPGVAGSVTSVDKVVTGTLARSWRLPNNWQVNTFTRGSGPLDEDAPTEPVVLADLSGMRSSTKFGAGISATNFPWHADPALQLQVCEQAFADTAAAPDTVRQHVEATLRGLRDVTPARRDSVWSAAAKTLSATLCRRSVLAPIYQRQFDRALRFGLVWLLAVGGEYGRHTYRYADTVAVSYLSKQTESYALNVGAGVYVPPVRLMLALTPRGEQSWDPGISRQYCVPVGTTAALQCRTVPLGAPSRRAPALVQLEARWFATSRWGLSPRLTVDARGSDGWGFEIPVLFRQPADKGFTSAAGVGWRSKAISSQTDDQLYLTLTVGVTFGVALQQGP